MNNNGKIEWWKIVRVGAEILTLAGMIGTCVQGFCAPKFNAMDKRDFDEHVNGLIDAKLNNGKNA